MGRRTWIKIYCEKWSKGSIRREDYITRSVFVDLLVMAGDNSYGENGIISLADGLGFTPDLIAGLLNIPVDIWQHAITRLSTHPDPAENRIEVIHMPDGRFTLKIINWDKYQSEYARIHNHKPPDKSSESGKSTKKVQKMYPLDRDRDIDKDKEKNKNKAIVPDGTGKKHPDPDLQEIMDYAKAHGFSIQGSHKQNRRYAYNLLRKKDNKNQPLGKELLKKMIDAAVAMRGEQYAPQINDFKALFYKFQDLSAFIKKTQQGGRIG